MSIYPPNKINYTSARQVLRIEIRDVPYFDAQNLATLSIIMSEHLSTYTE